MYGPTYSTQLNVAQRIFSLNLSLNKRRLLIKKIHLYLALISALPILVMSLSGVMLVYREAIEDFVTHGYMDSPVAGEKKSIEELRDILKKDFPQYEFEGVVLPPKEGRSYNYWIKDAPLWTVLYINPYTGEYKGTRAWEDWTLANIVSWLTDIHYSLKWGEPGSYIVGISSFILALSTLSGLFLWWPRGKFDSRKFRAKRAKRWKQTAYNFHPVIGFYTALALLVISISGTMITFWEPTKKLLHAVTLSPPPLVPPVIAATEGQATLPADQLIRIARDYLKTKYDREPTPEASSLPTKENIAVEISLQGNPGLAWADHFHVYVNAETGEVIKDQAPPSFNRGEVLTMWLGPLHFGTWGASFGPWAEQITRILWLLAAFSPLVLIITGLSIIKKSFWKRKS